LKTIINDITYLDAFTSNAKLLQYVIPIEGQTYDFISQDGINARNYTLSKRNGAGAYELPTNKDKVYLNYIPKKVFVTDQNLKDYTDTTFSYFIPPQVIEPDKFTLIEGSIFRCFDKDSLPQPKENYQYWIIEDGKKKKIPNYKTLEVMLAQRGITLLSVRVIPESQCEQIEEATDIIPDKSTAWNADMSDKTNSELLKQLDANVKSGAAIASAATAAAQQQIDTVKAQAAADKAAADAAKAQAQAAEAASQAAIAQANAAQAAAEAAIAALNS